MFEYEILPVLLDLEKLSASFNHTKVFDAMIGTLVNQMFEFIYIHFKDLLEDVSDTSVHQLLKSHLLGFLKQNQVRIINLPVKFQLSKFQEGQVNTFEDKLKHCLLLYEGHETYFCSYSQNFISKTHRSMDFISLAFGEL